MQLLNEKRVEGTVINSKLTPQMALPLSHNDKASFDNYWVGNNYELVTALRSMVQTSEQSILYVYGPHGSGKSHLLFAAMRLAKQEGVKTSYLSLSDEHISIDMFSILDVENLVFIDNIHAWANDQEKERTLFTLFEQIKHAGGQLVVASSQPPESSGFVIRDLVSRLMSGLIYGLHPLTEEQQLDAIKMRANQRGLLISEETVKFLLKYSSRDNRELFTILEQVDQASLVEKRRITIPFIQSLLKPSS